MFISKSHHEREISVWRTDLKRANEARDNWRYSAKEWEAKFKTAITDLEKQAGEIGQLKNELGGEALVIADLRSTIEYLRPDALAMRRKRQMDRDRRKAS